MASKANENRIKVGGDSTKKAEPARPGKRKKLASKEWEEEDNDDPEDEDFDVEKAKVEARMSPKQLPCKYYSKKFGRFCSKKFSSKVRLGKITVYWNRKSTSDKISNLMNMSI